MAIVPNIIDHLLILVERLSYALILLPFLGDFLERGRVPSGAREWITEVFIGVLIILYIAILRRTRRRITRLESLRQSLTRLLVHDMKNPLTCVMGALSCLSR